MNNLRRASRILDRCLNPGLTEYDQVGRFYIQDCIASKGKILLGRSRHQWNDNIKVYVNEVMCILDSSASE